MQRDEFLAFLEDDSLVDSAISESIELRWCVKSSSSQILEYYRHIHLYYDRIPILQSLPLKDYQIPEIKAKILYHGFRQSRMIHSDDLLRLFYLAVETKEIKLLRLCFRYSYPNISVKQVSKGYSETKTSIVEYFNLILPLRPDFNPCLGTGQSFTNALDHGIRNDPEIVQYFGCRGGRPVHINHNDKYYQLWRTEYHQWIMSILSQYLYSDIIAFLVDFCT